jgi:hypothetical protein
MGIPPGVWRHTRTRTRRGMYRDGEGECGATGRERDGRVRARASVAVAHLFPIWGCIRAPLLCIAAGRYSMDVLVVVVVSLQPLKRSPNNTIEDFKAANKVSLFNAEADEVRLTCDSPAPTTQSTANARIRFRFQVA